MTDAAPEAVVVDTMVVSWLIEHDSLSLRDLYRRLIKDAPFKQSPSSAPVP